MFSVMVVMMFSVIGCGDVICSDITDVLGNGDVNCDGVDKVQFFSHTWDTI